MELGAWPRPIVSQDSDHALQLRDGKIFCGHGTTADRLDCLNAGVVRDFTELSGTSFSA